MIQCIKVHVIAGEKMNTYRIAVCDDDPVMRPAMKSQEKNKIKQDG